MFSQILKLTSNISNFNQFSEVSEAILNLAVQHNDLKCFILNNTDLVATLINILSNNPNTLHIQQIINFLYKITYKINTVEFKCSDILLTFIENKILNTPLNESELPSLLLLFSNVCYFYLDKETTKSHLVQKFLIQLLGSSNENSILVSSLFILVQIANSEVKLFNEKNIFTSWDLLLTIITEDYHESNANLSIVIDLFNEMLKKKNLREGLIFYNSLRPFLKTVFEKLAKDQNLHALLFEVIEISILNEYDLPNLYSLIKEYEVMKMPLNLINGYFHKDSFNNDTSRLNKKILLNSINFLKFGFLNSEIRKQNKYNFQNIFTQLIDLILTNLTTVASDINRHFLKQINLLELIKLMIQFLEQVVEEEDYFNTEHLVAKFNIPYLTNEILEHLEKNAILKNSAVFDVMDNSCIEQLFIYKFRLLLMLNLIDKCNYQKIKQSNNLPILCSTLFTTSMDPDEMKTILFVVNKFFFEKSFFENVAVLNKNTKIDFLKLNQKVKEDETSVKFIKKEGCKSSETMDDLESIENMERVLVEVTEKFNLENKLRASLLNKKIEIFENKLKTQKFEIENLNFINLEKSQEISKLKKNLLEKENSYSRENENFIKNLKLKEEKLMELEKIIQKKSKEFEEFEEITESKNKLYNQEKLTHENDMKAAQIEIKSLKNRVAGLESELNERDDAHEEMVAKLLEGRKKRIARKPLTEKPFTQIESQENNLLENKINKLNLG